MCRALDYNDLNGSLPFLNDLTNLQYLWVHTPTLYISMQTKYIVSQDYFGFLRLKFALATSIQHLLNISCVGLHTNNLIEYILQIIT
jgi:hypothetical protein